MQEHMRQKCEYGDKHVEVWQARISKSKIYSCATSEARRQTCPGLAGAKFEIQNWGTSSSSHHVI
jgi:hypothetical protein